MDFVATSSNPQSKSKLFKIGPESGLTSQLIYTRTRTQRGPSEILVNSTTPPKTELAY